MESTCVEYHKLLVVPSGKGTVGVAVSHSALDVISSYPLLAHVPDVTLKYSVTEVAHSVFPPVGSSPAGLVFPEGQAVQTLATTCSFSAQAPTTHPAEVQVASVEPELPLNISVVEADHVSQQSV